MRLEVRVGAVPGVAVRRVLGPAPSSAVVSPVSSAGGLGVNSSILILAESGPLAASAVWETGVGLLPRWALGGFLGRPLDRAADVSIFGTGWTGGGGCFLAWADGGKLACFSGGLRGSKAGL